MTAIFSPCGSYRLRLDRVIDMLGGPTIAFCLHNPSTAGVDNDDPTSRRGIAFATAWGASRLVYVNPWAGCATKPRDLWAMPDPIGQENDRHIAAAARECADTGGFMVAAWGAISPPAASRRVARGRLAEVHRLICGEGCEVRALGVNQDGSPKHPLYVRADARPLPWPDGWAPGASRPAACEAV